MGSLLVKKLIKDYSVTVIDTQWFGNFLDDNKYLNIIKGDIRHDLDSIDFLNLNL